jgi:hypothetical protein
MSSPATTEVEVNFLVCKKPCAASSFFKWWLIWEFFDWLSGCSVAFYSYQFIYFTFAKPDATKPASTFSIVGLIFAIICMLPLVIFVPQLIKSIMLALKNEEMAASGELRSKFEEYMKNRMLGFYLITLVTCFRYVVVFISAFMTSGDFIVGLVALVIGVLISGAVCFVFYILLAKSNTGGLEQAADILCGGGSMNAKEPMVQPSDFAPH